jgi:hypothetical protein
MLAFSYALCGDAFSQATLPIQPKQVVVTCFSGIADPSNTTQNLDGYVLAHFDTRPPMPGAVPGSNWVHPPSYVNHNDPPAGSAGNEWTARNLGEVFGVTLSDGPAPDIFVTSTTIYGFSAPSQTPLAPAGPAGYGGVYKIDGITGDIISKTLPDSGDVGLGNVCFHRPGDDTPLIYVSNFDDGLIYRIDSTGAMTCLNTFDHGIVHSAQDAPSVGLTPLDRRIWGVKVFEDRLYYAVWSTHSDNQTGNPNSIWSVALNPTTGDFDTTSNYKEFDIPDLNPTNPYSNPVATIEFSDSGQMYLAERATRYSSFAHRSRVLEYNGSTTGWTPVPDTKGGHLWKIGGGTSQYSGQNSTGGVAADCDDSLWVTGDALIYQSGQKVYGLQQIAVANECDVPGTINSIMIDLDQQVTINDKSLVGAVDIFDPCACLELVGEVKCPAEEGGAFTFDFTVTNTSGQTANSMILHPVSGTTGISPATHTFSPPLADGDSRSFAGYEIQGATAGGTACFRVILLTEDRVVCCNDEVCVDIPECRCFEVLEQVVECDPASGKATVTVTIRNYEAYDLHHAYIIVGPNKVVSPASGYIPLNPPITPYGTGTFTFTLCNVLPGELCCFTIAVHSEDFEQCCWDEVCVRCDDMPPPADSHCDLTPDVICDPATGVGTISLTIFNGDPTPKTFLWNVAFLAPSVSCPIALSAADFSPSSGSVSVPGNGFVTVPITVLCDKLKAAPIQGACANYGIYVCEAGTNNCFGCRGTIRCAEVVGGLQGAPGPFPIQVGAGRDFVAQVRNDSSVPRDVQVEIGDNLTWLVYDRAGDIDRATPKLSESLRLDPGESVDIPFTAFLLEDGEQFARGVLLPLELVIRPAGAPDQRILAYLQLEDPVVAPLISVTQMSCLQIEQVGRLIRIDCDVKVASVIRIERSSDLRIWEPTRFGNEEGALLDKASLEAEPGPVSYFLNVDTPRYFYRLLAEEH